MDAHCCRWSLFTISMECNGQILMQYSRHQLNTRSKKIGRIYRIRRTTWQMIAHVQLINQLRNIGKCKLSTTSSAVRGLLSSEPLITKHVGNTCNAICWHSFQCNTSSWFIKCFITHLYQLNYFKPWFIGQCDFLDHGL